MRLLEGLHQVLSRIWFLLVPALAATSTPATGGLVSWTFHAWRPTDGSVTLADVWQLPEAEDAAYRAVCSQLGSGSPGVPLAISVSGFHPATRQACSRAGLACVQSSSDRQSEQLPEAWSGNAVPFYPANDLLGELLLQAIDWLRWSSFVLIYDTEAGFQLKSIAELAKYRRLVNRVPSPITFRQLDPSKRNETLAILRWIRDTNVNNILLDATDQNLGEILSLAEIARCTGPQYNYLHMGSLNLSYYMDRIAYHMLSGINVTHIDMAPLDSGSGSLLFAVSAAQARWLRGVSLVNRALANLSKSAASLRDKGAALTAAGDCNVIRPASSDLKEKIQATIYNAMGSQLISGRRVLNFSFLLSRMNVDSLEPFATWTLERGFRKLVGADESRHYDAQLRFLRKQSLSVVTAEFPPFVMYRTHDEDLRPVHGNDRWYGLSIDLFARIAKLNGLSYHIYAASDASPGIRLALGPDGVEKWSGMVGEIMSGRADVGVGPFSVTYEREKVIDFTTPYMSVGLTVLMKRTEVVSSLFQFLNPFHRDVWLYTALALAVFTLVVFVIARLSPQEWFVRSSCSPVEENIFTLHNCMWFAVSSTLQQGSELAPTALSVRVAGAFWWFFVLVIVSSYTANLAAFLTVNKLNEITTLSQLVSQDNVKYSIISSDSTFTFFSNSNDSIFSAMFKKMLYWNATGQAKFIENSCAALQQVKAGGFAGILESPLVEFYKERDCDLIQVGDVFNPSSYGFAVVQGNTILRNMMTETILQLIQEQYIVELSDKWLKEFNISGEACSKRSSSLQSPAPGTLTIDAFSGLFVILAAGLALSTGVLICEIVLNVQQTQGARSIWLSDVLMTLFQRAFLGYNRRLEARSSKQFEETSSEVASVPAAPEQEVKCRRTTVL